MNTAETEKGTELYDKIETHNAVKVDFMALVLTIIFLCVA